MLSLLNLEAQNWVEYLLSVSFDANSLLVSIYFLDSMASYPRG